MVDNYQLWEQHEHELEKELEKCPMCDCCGEYIQDDYFYNIGGDILCLDCLNDNYRYNVEV